MPQFGASLTESSFMIVKCLYSRVLVEITPKFFLKDLVLPVILEPIDLVGSKTSSVTSQLDGKDQGFTS